MPKRKTYQPITWKNKLNEIYTQDGKAVTTSTGIPSHVCRIIMEYALIINEVDWVLSAPEENVKAFVICHPKRFLERTT